MVGVNPEVAHEQMAGLNFFHAVAQAIEAGKLFHIDLNDQKPGRFDQDLRFGSESIKALFFLVKLLEESGYDGPRHFDAHAYRTEDQEGVWDFARGCMRTYLMLKSKVQQFAAHAGIQALLAEIRGTGHDARALLSGARRTAQRADIRPRRTRQPPAPLRASGPAHRRPAARRALMAQWRSYLGLDVEHAEPHRGRDRGRGDGRPQSSGESSLHFDEALPHYGTRHGVLPRTDPAVARPRRR